MAAMADLSHAYADPSAAGRRLTVSQVERAHLCDLFDRLGPDAPTLSGDWDTHHLVAHLRLRESSPLGSLKTTLSKVADSALEELVAAGDYGGLVDAVRHGPPRLSIFGTTRTDRDLNTLEFLIHHEDVRRAGADWSPRALPTWAEDQIWSRARVFAKMLLRRQPVGILLERADTGEQSVAVKRDRPAVIRGLPSELALYAYGRRAVAQVEFDGPVDVIQRLQRKAA